MDLDRRALLAGLGALAAAPRALIETAHAGDHAGDHLGDAFATEWLASAETGEGAFAPVTLSPGLEPHPAAARAARLHWVEPAPGSPLAVAMGRRPGSLAIAFDRRSGAELATFTPGAGRCFSGHGRFLGDGSRFLAVEIDRASDAGTLTLRDPAAGFAVLAEWPTGGPGPHDLMPHAGALMVANGGVEPFTSAAVGHDVTGSGIALLDPATGTLRNVVLPGADLASLSLRHFAEAPRGPLVVAAQDLVQDGVGRPLLFRVEADGAVVPFDAPEEVWLGFRGYIGSTAVDVSGGFVAASSPRGGRIGFWSASGRFIGILPLADGCGLAPCREAGRFLASSGLGDLVLVDAREDGVGIVARRRGGPRFDNHMSRAAS